MENLGDNMQENLFFVSPVYCEDKPEFLPIPQEDVRRALFLRTFWIVLHIVTCFAIIAGNGRTLGIW